jgi:DNA-binding MarR family transcriptional regulator
MNPRVLYLIKRMEIESAARMADAMQQYNLTPIQYAILYFVDHDKGDFFSSSQLSRRFSMTAQSMNEFVGVLEKKRLLKKTTDPSHKRILRIALTAKGKKTLKDCNRKLDVVEEKFLEKLTKRQTEIFRDLIGKIMDYHGRHHS